MINLVFLGRFRPLASASLKTVEPPANIRTLQDLRDWIGVQIPALGMALAAAPYQVIVNHAVVHDLSTCFRSGDEIAFMPPMSGG